MKIPQRAFAAALLTTVACGPSPAQELRVGFASHCPMSTKSPGESTLTAAGVALLADFGRRIVGEQIDKIAKQMAEDQVVKYTATGRMSGFYSKSAVKPTEVTLNGTQACLLVALGKFRASKEANPSPGAAKAPNPLPGAAKAPNPLPGAAKALTSEDIGKLSKVFGDVEEPLRFYMEGVFEVSDDRTAFAFLPTYFYYPAFINEGTLFSSSKHDILVRVEWLEPGEASVFAVSQLQWDAVVESPKGVVIADEAGIKGKQSEWMKLPQIAAPSGPGVFGPVNVKVLVSETAKPHSIAKYLGDALKGQKDAITKETQSAITQAVSTEARLAAKLKLNEAAQTANAAYVAAYDDAAKAFDAWNDAKDGKPEKLNAARLAYQRLPSLEQLARGAFGDAGIPFEPRPSLKPLP